MGKELWKGKSILEAAERLAEQTRWSISRQEVMMRTDRHTLFSLVALLMSQRSTCQRLKVGAILVKDGRIISVGYNGPASGVKECVECLGEACDRSVHAETNAISYAAREGLSVKDSTLYCNYTPCINCAKVIAAAGISRLVYIREYRKREGLSFLEEAGVECLPYSRLGYESRLQDSLVTMRENLDLLLAKGYENYDPLADDSIQNGFCLQDKCSACLRCKRAGDYSNCPEWGNRVDE